MEVPIWAGLSLTGGEVMVVGTVWEGGGGMGRWEKGRGGGIKKLKVKRRWGKRACSSISYGCN